MPCEQAGRLRSPTRLEYHPILVLWPVRHPRSTDLFSGFVEVDFDVFGSATGGDDVEFAIAIEISKAKVFAGHAVVIDRHLGPVHALWKQFDAEEFDADASARFVHGPPADDDLIFALAEEVTAGEGVAVN